MGRRVRHFNPRDAGASMVLDSRYILPGNVSGTNLSTWNSRTTSTYNATAPSNNPQYITGVKGGQPVVRFTSDITRPLQSANISFRNSHIITVFDKKSNPGSILTDTRSLICRGGSTSAREFYVFYYGSNVNIQVSDSSLFPSTSVAMSVGWGHIDAYVENTSFGIALNLGNYSTSSYSFTPTGNFNISIGVLRENSQNIRGFDSDVGNLVLFNSKQSTSLTRRCVHCQAFSFKVPV